MSDAHGGHQEQEPRNDGPYEQGPQPEAYAERAESGWASAWDTSGDAPSGDAPSGDAPLDGPDETLILPTAQAGAQPTIRLAENAGESAGESAGENAGAPAQPAAQAVDPATLDTRITPAVGAPLSVAQAQAQPASPKAVSRPASDGAGGGAASSPAQPRPLARTAAPARRRGGCFTASLVMLALLIPLLIPSALAVNIALQDYTQIRALGLDGVHHLYAAEADLLGKLSSGGGGGSACAPASAVATTPTTTTSATAGAVARGIPSATAVAAAQTDLHTAQRDFQRLQAQLDHPDWVLSAAANAPYASGKIRSARGLANIGYDVATIGGELVGAVAPLLARAHGASPGSTALLTQADVDTLHHALVDSQALLVDLQQQAQVVNVSDLPICAAEQATFTKLVGEIPRARDLLAQGDNALGALGWALGADATRHFLVQTLDRTELRATGGFAGEYGVVTVQHGRVDSFTLNNVDLLDYGHYSNGWAINNRPPAAYSWWPIANWGLRDANLNPDFPTNAKLVMQVFKNEGGGDVDGVVNVTPVAIAHLLNVTGPLYVPGYDETVTATNLEERIHYYQLTPEGQAINQRLYPNDTPAFARKRFAQLVARLLAEQLRTLPTSRLVEAAQSVFGDLQNKEVQVYVTNPALEGLLTTYHADGAMDVTPGVDGFFVAQTNWGAAKSTPHIQVNEADDVTLDAKGGATHHFTMTLRNDPGDTPYYGFVTYQDYVRIYAPPTASLLSADGFDSGTPLCTYPHCSDASFAQGELVCPGGYGQINRTNTLAGNDSDRPLDAPGGPTQTTSDVANRAMWGGNIVVPVTCVATLTMAWYVPAIAAPASGVPHADAPYTELAQRQAGTYYSVNITIHPAAGVAADGAKTTTCAATLSANLRCTLGKPAPRLPTA